jgi:hypothetical protein
VVQKVWTGVQMWKSGWKVEKQLENGEKRAIPA